MINYGNQIKQAAKPANLDFAACYFLNIKRVFLSSTNNKDARKSKYI